MIIPK